MLKPGDTAPQFTLPDQSGTEISLTELLGTGELVLYFYPADFTPVCTAQACAMRDRFDALHDMQVQIVGISPQSVASHQRFAASNALPFPLLFDDRKRVIRQYGVDGPLGFGVRRATFHIGQDGVIINRAVADFTLGGHVELINTVLNRHERTT